ncbi:MAG: Rieske (2Fe-2S) protein [Myxococcales bacterium]|nr:Rieske (2Fe-2S) protein [Myxococcales bacterium]
MGRGPSAMPPEPGWFAVAESSWVGAGRAVPVRCFGLDLVMWRTSEGQLALMSDRCPHRGASLSRGTVDAGCLACPLHGFRFDPAGSCVAIDAGTVPPLLRTRSLPVREAYGMVFAWLHADTPTAELPWFDDLEGLAHHSRRIRWDVHWSRVVARQLDRIPGPRQLRSDACSVRTWSVDGGPEHYVEWRAPNLLISASGVRSRVLLVVVPVDRHCTELIVRTYARASVWSAVVLWLASWWHERSIGRDRLLVEGQTGEGSRGNGDVLVASDAAVAAFRRIREARQLNTGS